MEGFLNPLSDLCQYVLFLRGCCWIFVAESRRVLPLLVSLLLGGLCRSVGQTISTTIGWMTMKS